MDDSTTQQFEYSTCFLGSVFSVATFEKSILTFIPLFITIYNHKEDLMLKKEEVKIGIAWYTKEQWEKLKKVAADFKGDETYDNWKRDMEELIEEIRERGQVPEKINIDIEELQKWCERNGKPIISESRSAYVAFLLQEKYKK